MLGLVVTEMLYEAFPEASEGDLSVRLAGLVRRETCAEVAESWEVGPHVILGAGEARAGGRKKAAILGDVCEALIGAVFLDGGFAAARAVVRRHWQARMLADAAPIQDAKTAVQEWAQARGLATPSYREIERSGPAHLPQFVMQVELDGYAPEQGAASSKRAAEQAAAQAFLERWAAVHDRMRLRRPDRRAERRQVDADQQARRRQGGDRLAQGADDARAGARRRDRGRGADHVRRHARACSRRSAGSTGR